MISNHAEWIEHLAAAQARTDAQIAETSKSLKEFGEATDAR